VRGVAGDHQDDGARVALGMPYGAKSWYFSMWIVADQLQSFG
jgi:acetyl-CoA C-acetyltransferase